VTWKCPACQTSVRYDGDQPEPRRVYRCVVCRLELVLDEHGQQLIVPPIEEPLPKVPPTLTRPPRTVTVRAKRIGKKR